MSDTFVSNTVTRQLVWMVLVTGLSLGGWALPAVLQEAVAQEEAADDAAPEDAAADDAAADDAAPEAAGDDVADDAVEGAAKPAPPAGKPKEAEKSDEPPVKDPVVLDLVRSNPKTPAELFRVVANLVDLQHPRQARPFLKQLIDAKLDDPTLAGLVRDFGTPRFLRLARSEELQPEANAFVDSAMAASERQMSDPARLAALLPQLRSPSPEVRRAAIVDLIQAKEAAVEFLLHSLATANDDATRASITSALVEFDSMAVGPLIGALESNDPKFKVQVITALGLLEADRAALYLAGPAVLAEDEQVRETAMRAVRAITGVTPTRRTAAVALHRQMQRYIRGTRPFAPDHEGLVTLWHWDDATKKSVSKRYPVDEVGIVLAAQLARSLYAIEPDNQEYRRWYLVALLEAAKMRYGFDKPLPRDPGSAFEAASAAGPDAVTDVMQYALANNHHGAAVGAAEVLAAIATPETLVGTGSEPSPLVQAAASGDRRVRFAALSAVMQLDPRHPFAGSSLVADALAYFASPAVSPRVLIGHPRGAEGQNIAALLSQLGYETEVAYTGRRLIERTFDTADVQFIFIYMGIDDPDVRETVYELRKNVGTNRTPIALIAGLDNLEYARSVSAEVPLTLSFSRPHDVKGMEFDIGKLKQLAGRGMMTPAEMEQQTLQTLAWISTLAERPRSIYDLRRLDRAVLASLPAPTLTTAAANTLARLDTVRGQRAIVELASAPTTALETRQALVKSLVDSIERKGVLLTSDEIVRQYERYNASEKADAGTQQVLGAILDAIEEPTRAATRGKQPPQERNSKE